MTRLTTFLMFMLFACGSPRENTPFPLPATAPEVIEGWNESLTTEVYHDKVLGMLIGSAIGDAMGAPTEMWHRNQIQATVGYVHDLNKVVREGSPEGPWEANLPGGSTTDDTRWKLLATQFLARKPLPKDSLDDVGFATFIVGQYNEEKSALKNAHEQAPAEIDRNLRRVVWLQEWAKVAEPFIRNDLRGYSNALGKFYGGEMACGGMLYAPVIGAFFPAMPVKAYRESYRLGIFDLGYARDITGLTAAYVSKAMQPGIPVSAIGEVTRLVDPEHYFDSRLVGRIANRIYEDAKGIAFEMNNYLPPPADDIKLPAGFAGDTLRFLKIQKAYSLLDQKLQDIPFHAAEIHLINLTAIECSGGDFRRAIEFVVNYGRDNDTVAAVTGAILGAYWGASNLPRDWSDTAMRVNQEVMGIDLASLADALASAGYRGEKKNLPD